jgi:hypothetical protein
MKFVSCMTSTVSILEGDLTWDFLNSDVLTSSSGALDRGDAPLAAHDLQHMSESSFLSDLSLRATHDISSIHLSRSPAKPGGLATS